MILESSFETVKQPTGEKMSTPAAELSERKDAGRISRRSAVVLCVFILLALLANALWLVILEDRYYWSDEGWYVENARALLSGQPYESATRRCPGTIWLLAAWMGLFGDSMSSLRISNLFLGSVASVIGYRIAEDLFGGNHRTGIVAGVLCLCYPFFVYMRGFLLSENLAIVLLAFSTWCLLSAAESDSKPKWLLAGLLAGLTNLARPVLLLMPVFIPIVLLATSSRSWKKLTVTTLVFVVGFASVICLWSLRNHQLVGSFALSSATSHQLYKGALTPPGEKVTSFSSPGGEATKKQLLEFIRSDFSRFLWYKLYYAVRFWSPQLDHVESQGSERLFSALSWCILVPVYALAVLGWRRADRKGRLVLLAIILQYWLFHVIVVVKFRYRIPLDFVLLVLAAGGLCSFAAGLRSRLPSACKRCQSGSVAS